MYLIIGLGNPGKKYELTRHNAGERAVRLFHALHIEDLDGWSKKFNSEVSEGAVEGQKVILLLPQTFMNNSGDAAREAADFWKHKSSDIIIVYDDIDIPLGELRIRESGSSGGHKGVASVLSALGTEDIPRLRIGTGTDAAKKIPSEDFVLQRFSAKEKAVLDKSLRRAAEALETILTKGIAAAMNTHNI